MKLTPVHPAPSSSFFKVLTMDNSMKKKYLTVKALPHSKSTTDFLEIALRGDETRKLAVTEHHTVIGAQITKL